MGAPHSGGRFGIPELLQTEPGNKPPVGPPASGRRGGPRGPRDDPLEPPPKSCQAFGLRDPGERHQRAFPKERRPGRPVCPSPGRAPAAARIHPRRPSRCGSPTVHQSPHVLVTSPQVRADFGAARGRRGGRGARGARAVGAGTRGAAARAGGCGRGGSRPAVAPARQPAPSGRPQPRTRHARRALPAQPSARRPVRRPPTARPPRWPRAPHGGRPMGAARGAPPANGRAPRPGGAGGPGTGRGGADSRAPSPVSARPRTQRSAPPFGRHGGDGRFLDPAPSVPLPGGRRAKNSRLLEAMDGRRAGRGRPERGDTTPPS